MSFSRPQTSLFRGERMEKCYTPYIYYLKFLKPLVYDVSCVSLVFVLHPACPQRVV